MAGDSPQAPPGWYQDPNDAGQRYWDGTRWTEHVAPAPAAPGPEAPGSPAARPPRRAQAQTLTTVERIWGAVAFGIAVIGSIGPWATLGIFSKAGTDGDGVITLIAAMVGILVALIGPPGARDRPGHRRDRRARRDR